MLQFTKTLADKRARMAQPLGEGDTVRDERRPGHRTSPK
jgi:hypothetical protein